MCVAVGVPEVVYNAAKLYPVGVCVCLIKIFAGFEVHFFANVMCVRSSGRRRFILVSVSWSCIITT